MTEIVVLLLIGFFLGGMATDIRWIRRLRRLRGELDPNQAAQSYASAALGLPGLRPLRDQLTVDAGVAPSQPSVQSKP